MIVKMRLCDIRKHSDIVIAYDNFDFMEKIRHQVSGRTGTIQSVTTGKAFFGHDIPDGGLLQSMLHEDIRLDFRDVLVSPGLRRDSNHQQMSRFFIAQAIQGVYPNVVKRVYQEAFNKEFSMPILDEG